MLSNREYKLEFGNSLLASVKSFEQNKNKTLNPPNPIISQILGLLDKLDIKKNVFKLGNSIKFILTNPEPNRTKQN